MTTSSHRVIATIIIIIITGVATGGTVTGITTATGESFGPSRLLAQTEAARRADDRSIPRDRRICKLK
jgi:hypothetical protein